jgi:hypothetical protein
MNGQCGYLFTSAGEKRIGLDHERVGAQLGRSCKNGSEVSFAGGFEDVQLEPKGGSGSLQVVR